MLLLWVLYAWNILIYSEMHQWSLVTYCFHRIWWDRMTINDKLKFSASIVYKLYIGIWTLFHTFNIMQDFNIVLWLLINLINDDTFVLAAMANMCTMVHLFCLFMKTHLLALLLDNCPDLVCYAFLCKLSACMRNITAFCQHLLRPTKLAILADIIL